MKNSSATSVIQKLLWFRDPHLLRSKVDQMFLQKIPVQEILELVYRHSGASNQHVYHSVFKGLFSQGKSDLAWTVYKRMKQLQKVPSPHSNTLFLTNLATMAQDHTLHNKMGAIFKYAHEFYENIESPSVIHLNAYLRIYK